MSDDQLGKYRLLKKIARGGMGEVFFARQEGPAGFQKPAVVKRVLANLAQDQKFTEMFLNEARLAALLQHANVVQIFELGESDGRYFIAMEYLHGRNLRTVRRKLREHGREFPPAQLARIVSQALMGLHYAHTRSDDSGAPLGIIHRDMSPENIMVGFDGAVKVLDFGIAKAANASIVTQAGGMKGKFAYLSPEHVRGEVLDARVDVWAVGVTMYEMLSGTRPFDAVGDLQLARQIESLEPRPLHEVAPHVSPELSAIVHMALEKDREKRFASAEVLAAALERYAEAEGVKLTNSDTQQFMRELYGAEADENPAHLTPSSDGMPSQVISDIRSGDLQGRTPWLFYLAAAIALSLFTGGMVSVLRVKEPPPAAVAVAPPEPKVERVPMAVDAGAPLPVADAGESTAHAPAPVRAVVPVEVKGHVDLRVLPWAEVFDGKKSLGITPLAPFELGAGPHTLTLRNGDLNVTRDVVVRVTKNATTTVRIDLRDDSLR